ncbi:hypothetical protein M408DRAFT_193503 [Serendipita vermifera MAFF 305830]|uniref:Uncharacterized protein n=1 Tax=Serendipita vermifera MAFF 305830 TaxID=933852 RepID=A0A0C3APG0_SERVB|nr:hypothetical protein M408DRAFT_193503 [Serendipita vermifera MAFF 305830]
MSQDFPSSSAARRHTTIDRLPPELITLIFSCFYPISYRDLRDGCENWPFDIRFPTLLLGVCRKWRQILSQMPLMWRKILFEMYQGSKSTWTDRVPERLKWQLSMTGTISLDIAWYADESTDQSIIVNMYALITNYAPINRWRSLRYNHANPFPRIRDLDIAPMGEGFDLLEFLYTEGGYLESTLARSLDRSALCLREWHISDWYGSEADFDEEEQGKYGNTILLPDLQARITTFVNEGWDDRHLRGGLKNVTHLTGSIQEYLRLLPSLTHARLFESNLEELRNFQMVFINLVSLKLHLEREWEPEDMQIIHLPKLQHLMISWDSGDEKAPIAWMVMPLLRRLEFSFNLHFIPDNCMDIGLWNFFHAPKESHYQSDPSTLVIDIQLKLDVLITVLHHSLSTRELTITIDYHERAEDETVASLFTLGMEDGRFVESAEGVYCPHLTSLCIRLPWERNDLGRWVGCAWKIVKARNHDMFEGVRVQWSDSSESVVLKEHVRALLNWNDFQTDAFVSPDLVDACVGASSYWGLDRL